MLSVEFVKQTCKPGTTECCRYVVVGPDGFECEKKTPSAKALLDKRVAEGSMRATGDNCEGRSG